MKDLSLTNLILFFAFVFPGFLSMRVWSLLHPSKTANLKDSFLDAVAFSIVNFVIFFYPISLLGDPGFVKDNLLLTYLFVTIIFFAAPILWPAILLHILRRISKRGIILDLFPSAWDYFFGKKQGCWVIVHLKDGRRIGGLFDSESFASSFPREGSIYIQELWQLDASGNFSAKVPQTLGAVFHAGEYSLIELFERN